MHNSNASKQFAHVVPANNITYANVSWTLVYFCGKERFYRFQTPFFLHQKKKRKHILL